MIEQLPLLQPDPERVRRLTARCHKQLARQRRRIEQTEMPAAATVPMIERVVVGGLCATYLSAVVLDLLHVLDLRP